MSHFARAGGLGAGFFALESVAARCGVLGVATLGACHLGAHALLDTA